MGYTKTLPDLNGKFYPRNEDMLNLIELPGCLGAPNSKGSLHFAAPFKLHLITSLFCVCMRQNDQAPKMDDLMLEIAIVSWVWLGPYPYVRIKTPDANSNSCNFLRTIWGVTQHLRFFHLLMYLEFCSGFPQSFYSLHVNPCGFCGLYLALLYICLC